MKKLALLFFVLTTSFYTSCSDDDSEAVVVDESLIPGTWNLTGLSITDGKTTTNFNGTSLTADYTTIGKDFDMTVTFDDQTDPKTVTSSGTYTAEITTTILGQTTVQEESVPDLGIVGFWSFESPNSIIFTNNGITQNAIVLELNNNSMIIEQSFNETITEPTTGATVVTTGNLRTELTR